MNGSPDVLLRNDGHGRFVEVTRGGRASTRTTTGSASPRPGRDYDEDGWPDLLVANDFGRKNLYRNLGGGGRAGALPGRGRRGRGRGLRRGHERGLPGLRQRRPPRHLHGQHVDGRRPARDGARPGFMPDAPPEIRDIYRRHVRGNSLFRNRGDGTFEDVTLAARAEMGRWAWSSDAFDFDSDGWEDLYVVNGMFTRSGRRDGSGPGQLLLAPGGGAVAADPEARARPTTTAGGPPTGCSSPTGPQAQHERNVLLRNDGQGGFDEVSGSVGPRPRPGRPVLRGPRLRPRRRPRPRPARAALLAAAPPLPQRLRGPETPRSPCASSAAKSNRDAVGARVTVETDEVRRTRIVQAGSGFISQHSKELLFGLGREPAHPEGDGRRGRAARTQTFSDVPIDHRVWIEEGERGGADRALRHREPPAPAGGAAARPPSDRASAGEALALPARSRPRTSRCGTSTGQDHSLAALARPAGGDAVLGDLGAALRRGAGRSWRASARRWPPPASPSSPWPSIRPATRPKVRAAAATGSACPVLVASEEVAGTYTILNRYLFDRREDLRLPTVFLADAHGRDREGLPRARSPRRGSWRTCRRSTVSPAERLARAVPFAGTFHSRPGERNYFQYGLELSEQGFDAPALAAFERAARLDPSAITFYNLGTLYMKARPARGARAPPSSARSSCSRTTPRPATAWAPCSRRAATSPAAIERFRAALRGAGPTSPTPSTTSASRCSRPARRQQAYELYQKALALQPGLPRGPQQPRHLLRPAGRPRSRAERYFQQAVEKRPGYGEAANNLALVLSARGDAPTAPSPLLQRSLQEDAGVRDDLRDAVAGSTCAGGPAARSRPGPRAAAAAQPGAPARAPGPEAGAGRQLTQPYERGNR